MTRGLPRVKISDYTPVTCRGLSNRNIDMLYTLTSIHNYEKRRRIFKQTDFVMQGAFSLALNGQLARLPLGSIQRYQTPGTAETTAQRISREFLHRVMVIAVAIFSVSDFAVGSMKTLGELAVALVQIPARHCPGLKHLQPHIHLIRAQSHATHAVKLVPALFEGLFKGLVRPASALVVYRKWCVAEPSESRSSRWALLIVAGMATLAAGEYFFSLSSVVRNSAIPVTVGTLKNLSLTSIGSAGMAVFAVGATACYLRGSNIDPRTRSLLPEDNARPVNPPVAETQPNAGPENLPVAESQPKANTPPKQAERDPVVLLMDEFPTGVLTLSSGSSVINKIEQQMEQIRRDQSGYIEVHFRRKLLESDGFDRCSGIFIAWTQTGQARIWERGAERDVAVENIVTPNLKSGESPAPRGSGKNVIGLNTKINLTGNASIRRKQLLILAEGLINDGMVILATHVARCERMIKHKNLKNDSIKGVETEGLESIWLYQHIISARIAHASDVSHPAAPTLYAKTAVTLVGNDSQRSAQISGLVQRSFENQSICVVHQDGRVGRNRHQFEFCDQHIYVWTPVSTKDPTIERCAWKYQDIGKAYIGLGVV